MGVEFCGKQTEALDMKFEAGKRPEWKGKPKASPLDTDVEFVKLRNLILTGQMKLPQEAGLKVHEETDCDRLKTKNPARLVRDHLCRTLKDANLAPDYKLTCRQTTTPGEWGIWVTRISREAAAD
jgi:hypothetical protein